MVNNLVTLDKLYNVFKENYNLIPSKKAIIGLSGGIDSSLVAAIAINCLGKDSVNLYYMPYKTSSEESLTDAKKLCEKFNINLNIIDITSVADAFFKLNSVDTNLRKGNVLSRIRMITLFDEAKKHDGIVIGTTNKTEMLLGYGTWYGDMASSINPIGYLYKRDVIKLSKEIGLPESIITKKPTADLWPNQTDEEELGFTYDLADDFFYHAIELNKSKEFLYEKFTKEFTDSIIKRVLNNSFKRSLPKILTYFDNQKNFTEIDKILKNIIE